jgi:hypothetical protein
MRALFERSEGIYDAVDDSLGLLPMSKGVSNLSSQEARNEMDFRDLGFTGYRSGMGY